MRLKKLAFMAWTLLLPAVTLAQTEVTIDFTDQGYENAEEVTTLTQDGIIVTFDKGTGNTTPKYYNTGTAVRLYGGNTMKLESESKMTEVAFTFGSGEGSNAIIADNGTFADGSWTGEANDVTFTIDGTSGHRRIQKLVITLPEAVAPAVATPTFKVIPPSGDYGTVTVEIATETEGATIYYTTDGTTPTAESSEYMYPVVVGMVGVTVKAIAIKDGEQSAVASLLVPINPVVYNVASLTGFPNGTQFKYVSQLKVIANPTAKHLYVTDGYSGTTLLYDGTGEKFSAFAGEEGLGKYIASDWTGKVSFYNQLFEAVPDAALTVGYGSGDVTYPVKELSDVTAENVNQVVLLRGVTYELGSGRALTITKGDVSVAGYNQFDIEIEAAEEGKTYDIVGAIGRFNDNIQFQPITITDAVKGVEVPETATIEDWTIVANYSLYYNVSEKQYATKVAFDGTDIYIKGLAYDLKDNTDDWVKGTIGEGVVTIPSGQLVGYDVYGSKCYLVGSDDMQYGQGTITDIVFSYDADAKKLEAQTKYIIDNAKSDVLDVNAWLECVELYAGEPVVVEPVKVPEDMVTETWRLRSTQQFSPDYTQEISGKVEVGFDSDDVYVKGLNPYPSRLWIKATKNAEGKYVVPALQYMGEEEYYGSSTKYYFTSRNEDGEAVDVVFDYDEETRTLSTDQPLIISNAGRTVIAVQTFVGTTTIGAIPEVIIEELPYETTFQPEDEDAFKIIDANDDGNTWLFAYNTVNYYYDYNNAADDWLVTPKVKLEVGKLYSFGIDRWAQSENKTERIEVKLAAEPTAAALSAGPAVIEVTEFNNTVAERMSNEQFTVDETGYYYFGIHAISDAQSLGIVLANLKIDMVGTLVGISTISDGNDGSNTEIYNLNGIRVDAVQKGLYIVNGKKVVIK